jgi:hypothetical protein
VPSKVYLADRVPEKPKTLEVQLGVTKKKKTDMADEKSENTLILFS